MIVRAITTFRRTVLASCLFSLTICFPGQALESAPETFVQALTRLGIHTDKASLITALTNPKTEVRGLAAAQLATLKATDALPAILYAAQVEKDPRTQTNLAAAATWMGSAEGLQVLIRMCHDTNLSVYVRLDAARHTFHEENRRCFEPVEEMMMPSAEEDARIGALYLLTQLPGKTSLQSARILELLVPMLRDVDLRMRLEATQGVRMLKRSEAIAPLKAALAVEQESIVRMQMESALAELSRPAL